MNKNSMFSHPGLFVHLVPEVAEGPADFRHTLSLSVAPKRARLLLWYTGTHTQTDIFYPQTAANTRLTCSHILKLVIYSTIKVPWRTIWLLTRTTQFLYRTVKVPAAVKKNPKELFYGNVFVRRWTDLYATDPEVLENNLIPGSKRERSERQDKHSEVGKNMTCLFFLFPVFVTSSGNSPSSLYLRQWTTLYSGWPHLPLDHAAVPEHTVSEWPHWPNGVSTQDCQFQSWLQDLGRALNNPCPPVLQQLHLMSLSKVLNV